jgi:hypothetical protein
MHTLLWILPLGKPDADFLSNPLLRLPSLTVPFFPHLATSTASSIAHKPPLHQEGDQVLEGRSHPAHPKPNHAKSVALLTT